MVAIRGARLLDKAPLSWLRSGADGQRHFTVKNCSFYAKQGNDPGMEAEVEILKGAPVQQRNWKYAREFLALTTPLSDGTTVLGAAGPETSSTASQV